MAALELFRGTKLVETSLPVKVNEENQNNDEFREEGAATDVIEDVGEEAISGLLKQLRASLLDSSEAIIEGVDIEAPVGGMSLLSLKNLLMADYLKQMLIVIKTKLQPFVSTKKSKGETEAAQKAVERLVELRVLLERIRPVESKLKNLIDRLVRQANQEKNFQFSSKTNDEPRSLRARPEDMILDDDNEGESSGESGDHQSDENESDADDSSPKGSKVKKYKPPQLSAAYYDPNWEQSASGANRRDKTKTSAEHRLMMRNLLENAVGDEPEEIVNEEEGLGFASAAEKRRKVAEERHRQRFEEDNFIRLPMEKKKRSMPTSGTFDKVLLYGRDDIDDDDLRVFAANDSEMPTVGYAAASNKRFKKKQKKIKRKAAGRAKQKRAKKARRK